MGQQQSKDELLYEQVLAGNVGAVRALCAEGASLQWVDKGGKTPLIVACMNPELYVVAKTLIELGANVNYYRPGCHAGTPLHHAAKRGLDQTVMLLLSHGANPLVRNDDCQTPLDVARIRGFNNVVRAIESHICLFSGWLREFFGPGFLEALAPQLLSRKIWVVVLPCITRSPVKPLKLELVIYSTPQDPQPRTVIALSKATIEELKFQQPDPTLILFYKSTRTRYKFAPANAGDKEQIQSLYNACQGVPQATSPPVLHYCSPTSVPASTTEAAAEAVQLAMAINSSILSAMEDKPSVHPNAHPSSEAINANGWGNTGSDNTHNGWGLFGGHQSSDASSSKASDNGWASIIEPSPSEASSSKASDNGWASLIAPPPSESISTGWIDGPAKEEHNGWGGPESNPDRNTKPQQHFHKTDNSHPPVQASNIVFPSSIPLSPSAPPVPDEVLDEGPIRYPSIDLTDCSTMSEAEDKGGGSSSSCCIICWEAPVEGACIPCGHMAGCMCCLNEIKTKKGDCPVCRANIDQVVRVYAV